MRSPGVQTRFHGEHDELYLLHGVPDIAAALYRQQSVGDADVVSAGTDRLANVRVRRPDLVPYERADLVDPVRALERKPRITPALPQVHSHRRRLHGDIQ